MSAEAWKPVVGYEGDYEISDLGRVRSHKMWRGQAGSRLLSPLFGNKGYLTVALSGAGGRNRKPTIHSLVMAAFVGPRPDDQEVRHLNGQAHDNRLVNLAYGTHAENYGDMFRHGTHPMASRTHCKNGHEFTEENSTIETTKSGSSFRRCRACVRDAWNSGDRLASAKQEAWAAGYAAGRADALRGEGAA